MLGVYNDLLCGFVVFVPYCGYGFPFSLVEDQLRTVWVELMDAWDFHLERLFVGHIQH